jgi:hypothetical protein
MHGIPRIAGRRRRQAMHHKSVTVLLGVFFTAAAFTVASALPATAMPTTAAQAAGSALAAVTSLNQVITNITVWIGGLLGGLATLLATVGGVRYLIANGDPAEIMKAKETLKYAAIGYGVAVLAPVLLAVLNGFVQ